MLLKNLPLALAAILVLSVAACSAMLGQKGDGTATSQGAFVDKREIVGLVPDVQAQMRMEAFAATNGYRLRDVTTLRSLSLIMLSFEMPEGTTGKQAIAELEAAVPGSTVGVNHAYRDQPIGISAAGTSYANTLMNWPASGCRALTPIGLIDTGVDAQAIGLSGGRFVQKSFTSVSEGPGRHGTEVASILSDPSRLRDVTLYGAAVIEDTVDAGRAAGADALVKALNWLVEENVKVVNVSLAGPANKLLALAIEGATERGMIIVAAVGNAGPNADALYPAAYPSVIAVTAVDAAGRIYRKAGRGQHVDIAAPGMDIIANSAQGARFVTGTSVAAPFVTARIAADPSLLNAAGYDQVRQRLAATSRDLGQTGSDSIYGSGLLQAEGICSS